MELGHLQTTVDAQANYTDQVARAKTLWDTKPKGLFAELRGLLTAMCSGNTRCMYCEDSFADEVEHIRPKTLYPDQAFKWINYLFACGPCNQPKNNKFALIGGGTPPSLNDITRRRNDPFIRHPAGPYALIDPRIENPMDFLYLDLQTFRFVPTDEDASSIRHIRSQYTIDVLQLNTREALVRGRKWAFSGFRARLSEYVQGKQRNLSPQRLHQIKAHLLSERHMTVWEEIKRQHASLEDFTGLFAAAPEALEWE